MFALNSEASFDARIPKRIARGADQLFLYSIKGGTTTIVDALVKVIESHQGQLHLNEFVTDIQIENNQVKAVETNLGNFYPAEIIVASGSAKETFHELVGDSYLPPELITIV